MERKDKRPAEGEKGAAARQERVRGEKAEMVIGNPLNPEHQNVCER